MYANAGRWNVAKPRLKTSKGYELNGIGAPSIGPNGIIKIDNTWRSKNLHKLVQEIYK